MTKPGTITSVQRPPHLLPVLIGITALCIGCGRRHAPSNLPSPDEVNGASALKEVSRFVNMGPRVSGTQGASRAAAFLSERLRGIGYRPLLHAFSDSTPDGEITFANVIGIPPGLSGTTLTNALAQLQTPAVILVSHYDTKSGISEGFSGANDSGSSTGLLLHLGERIAAKGATVPPVILAFVDGEESRYTYADNDGLHGSRHLAKQITRATLRDAVRAVIVLDMIGDKNLEIRIPRNTTRELLKLAFQAAEAEGVRSSFGLSDGSVLDDHVPFLEHDIPAIDLIDFTYGSAPGLNDYWHTDADSMDKLSSESLTLVGRVVLRMLEELGP